MKRGSRKWYQRKRAQQENMVVRQIRRFRPQPADLLLLTYEKNGVSTAIVRKTHERLVESFKKIIPKGVGLLTISTDWDLRLITPEQLKQIGLQRIPNPKGVDDALSKDRQ